MALRLDLAQLSHVRSEAGYLEMMALGVDKGMALRIVARHIGIGTDECMAIGDADNDLAMMHAAGMGVAVNNAGARVVAAADVVMPQTNGEGGVAAAFERFDFNS